MVTEIGFVSLLVAGLGAMAGGVGYLAVRIARGRW
ncbi:small membrane protein MtfM [Actinoplanes sp. NPDC049265]